MIVNPLVSGAGTTPVTGVTWDPAHTGAALTLASGNLEVICNSAGGIDQNTRSTTGKSSGKWYLELYTLAGGFSGELGYGIVTAGASDTAYVGHDTQGIAAYCNVGHVFSGGSIVATVGTWRNLVWVAMAVDVDNGLIWWRNVTSGQSWNNSGADPAAGSGGVSFAGLTGGSSYFAACNCDNPVDILANFGATAFAGTIPAGFSPWQS